MYFEIVIDGLLKNNFIENAVNVYMQLKKRNYESNEYSYTILTTLLSRLDTK